MLSRIPAERRARIILISYFHGRLHAALEDWPESPLRVMEGGHTANLLLEYTGSNCSGAYPDALVVCLLRNAGIGEGVVDGALHAVECSTEIRPDGRVAATKVSPGRKRFVFGRVSTVQHIHGGSFLDEYLNCSTTRFQNSHQR